MSIFPKLFLWLKSIRVVISFMIFTCLVTCFVTFFGGGDMDGYEEKKHDTVGIKVYVLLLYYL